jgi:hypothetical protein
MSGARQSNSVRRRHYVIRVNQRAGENTRRFNARSGDSLRGLRGSSLGLAKRRPTLANGGAVIVDLLLGRFQIGKRVNKVQSEADQTAAA